MRDCSSSNVSSSCEICFSHSWPTSGGACRDSASANAFSAGLKVPKRGAGGAARAGPARSATSAVPRTGIEGTLLMVVLLLDGRGGRIDRSRSAVADDGGGRGHGRNGQGGDLLAAELRFFRRREGTRAGLLNGLQVLADTGDGIGRRGDGVTGAELLHLHRFLLVVRGRRRVLGQRRDEERARGARGLYRESRRVELGLFARGHRTLRQADGR